jgi:CBS domain-containing protein
MQIPIRQILSTKGATVHKIAPDANVFEALKYMAETNVGALCVMEGDKLVGIISERDYARKVVLEGRSSSDTPVRDIMASKVLCARPDQTVGDAMAMMTAKAVRHLPVLEQKQVIGIVSIGDLVKAIIGQQQFMIEQLESYIHGSG